MNTDIVIAKEVYDNINSPHITRVILRYFDSLDSIGYWPSIAQVCHAWRREVGQFSRVGLPPYKLYYNAAAIAAHNIVPDLAVYTLLPHGLMANHMLGVTTEATSLPSDTIAELSRAATQRANRYPDVAKHKRLGWSGVEAVAAMHARWPIPDDWVQEFIRIWIYNGAFDCARALGGEDADDPDRSPLRHGRFYLTRYKANTRKMFGLQLECPRRFLHTENEPAWLQASSIIKQINVQKKKLLTFDRIIFADNKHIQRQAYALFKYAVVNGMLGAAADALAVMHMNAFNCAILWLINTQAGENVMAVFDAIELTNTVRPRYHPAGNCVILGGSNCVYGSCGGSYGHPQENTELGKRLAALNIAPMFGLFEYDRGGIHDITSCGECSRVLLNL